MGWLFDYHDIGRKAYIEKITSKAHFGEGYTPLMHRAVGNHVWQLVRHEPTGRKFITLDLIAKQKDAGWGYKGLSEDMGPYYYDCPLSLLDAADPPINDTAATWRQAVRDKQAERKAKAERTWGVGMQIRFGGHEYRLHSPAGKRKGWYATGPDGRLFRFGVSHLAKAEIVNATPEKPQ